ncbi:MULTISPECIES: SRPBCC family protein [unclassified Gordonia (in: high G+C Gram-positive bacteria)]|uniref:SRPBCC family protein n=1 Tax=unclassified Gordonia (in: high G+C Gram-positive bacteria) TaxID=2657482 RepID=UPI001FFF7AA2|nr:MULTISPECIES: SRPBCC family protein [unclassified Gordonia (in: high G+C Gram-positive bacteria)]UQE75333.1 SRPBCC family protein [Gordonia sp. PP30]
MGQVTAASSLDIAAAPEVVLAALSDYREVRPAILPANYRDYAVVEGGTGAGTVVHWILQATEKRSRDVLADVTASADSVTESDRNSSMVTVYRVTAAGTGSRVEVITTWQGAGGIGGFFEKTFAPKGLGRIQSELLGNLKTRLEP